MRSFTLALVFASVAFVPAIADGMKNLEHDQHAGSTKDDGQPEWPTPQVQVTVERGVRVWRPVQPAEDNGDQQQAQPYYYSQPSSAQPSYNQPALGYGGGGAFGGISGTNAIGSDVRNGAPAGPQNVQHAAVVKMKREKGRDRDHMHGRGEHNRAVYNNGYEIHVHGKPENHFPMGGKPVHQAQMGGKPQQHQGPAAGGKPMVHQMMPTVHRGPMPPVHMPQVHMAMHKPVPMRHAPRPPVQPVVHAPVYRAPAARPVVKVAARPVARVARHR